MLLSLARALTTVPRCRLSVAFARSRPVPRSRPMVTASRPCIPLSLVPHGSTPSLMPKILLGASLAGLWLISEGGIKNPYDDPDQRVRFLRCIRDGFVDEMCRHLASGADPNGRHPLGWAPLHVAAVQGQLEAVKKLLEAGADPNIPEEYTNIYHTAREVHQHSLHVMMTREEEFSDRLNLRANFRGCTPLHYAALADDLEVVKILLEAGADPLKANDYGRTPLDYARDEKSKALMKTYAAAIEERRKRQEQELRRKYPLERRIKDVIVGQDGAITTVASGETSFTDKNVGKAIVIDDLPLLRP